MDRWSVQIDATSCLLDLPSPCADAEVALLKAVCLGEMDAISCLRPASGTAQTPLAQSERNLLAALSVNGFVSNPFWLWTDLFPKWRRFRRQDPGREDVEIRLQNGNWWMRDEASRRRADETPDDAAIQNGWYAPSCLSIARPSLQDSSLARERLLLPAAVYDIEYAAAEIEEKCCVVGMAIDPSMSREIRTTSLSLPRYSGELTTIIYDPWLGMDRA
jgi:hypothetical protein